ncbi:branchpoint-bridging protein-like [Peromyscus leucopus]|uniref:branchpoint-bridging protein-like n=1 Tax=Peromyscus leucopus TaxID=10041 RepID=UPI00188570A7|nr:branchpoint-bridging protein-like [Peromyscus leucopus]
MRRQMRWGRTHRARTGRGRLVQRHQPGGPPRAVAAPAPWAGLTGCAAGGDCSQGRGSSRQGSDGGFEWLGRRPASGGGGGGGTRSRDLPRVPTRPRAPAAPGALGSPPAAQLEWGGGTQAAANAPAAARPGGGRPRPPQSPTMGQRSVSSSRAEWVPPWPPGRPRR